ncbi:MAG TPA: RNA methyltransferase [Cyclobacteriaceae bacterium]|nr:RNA methyltransferase [Cyclobacteriaceae bacterium]HRK55424.1 RNA methyltransferase [Cyclobacteriaceae bacterium]
MISKSQIKFIKSLQLKKYRKEEQCFVVDGEKGVAEVLKSDFIIEMLLVTESFRERQEKLLKGINTDLLIVSEKQLAQLSSFQTNESALAVVRQKPNQLPVLEQNEFILALDDLRDPGNLGTIIRTADWFGIRKIVASTQTADCYNPKVINSTMGSFTRVQIAYANLMDLIPQWEAAVYGALMEGEDVHSKHFEKRGVIVIGNEAKGISPEIQSLVTHKITIPGVTGAESLNAAVATGIILDNWSRLKK